MISNSASDLSQESLQIKQDGKFFSRLLSKESSMAYPSHRVYYGVAAGAVPFLWESQPGTPKNTIPTTTLPPLTPPPSYQFHSKKHSKKPTKHCCLIPNILPRLTLRKTSHTPSSNMLSSLWVSSSSSTFSPAAAGSDGLHRRSRTSPMLAFYSRDSDSDSDDRSPTLTLCFGVRHCPGGGLRGCH